MMQVVEETVIKRSRLYLIALGSLYYGFLAAIPILGVLYLVDLSLPARSQKHVGAIAVVILCLVIIYLGFRTALCKVSVDSTGIVIIVNPLRRYTILATDIRAMTLRTTGQISALRLRLGAEKKRLTVVALGPAEVGSFRQAIAPWSSVGLS